MVAVDLDMYTSIIILFCTDLVHNTQALGTLCIRSYLFTLNGACAVLQVEWQNTSAFVSKHFRELLYLLDPVLRAWSPYLPQVTMSVWRSLITWLGPLSGSRLRLVLAMMQQSLPDKQRLELSILEISWESGVVDVPNSGMAPQTL